VLLVAERYIARSDYIKYPEGKARLEPLAIIIFAVVMGMASVQLISESVQTIADSIASHSIPNTRIDWLAIGALLIVIAVKLALFVYCRKLWHLSGNHTIQALMQDHFNDILTNIAAVVAVGLILYDKQWWYIDPIAAMLISFYIIVSWLRTCGEQITIVVGITATPQLLSQMTYIAMHHPQVQQVDTVRAYAYGHGYLGEVDVVLDGDMHLRYAHDIGEALELSLEKLDNVSRVFVHLDFESTHTPEYTRRQNTARAQQAVVKAQQRNVTLAVPVTNVRSAVAAAPLPPPSSASGHFVDSASLPLDGTKDATAVS